MNLNFRSVAATATSLFAIGALGTCSPATAVWANDYPLQIMAAQAPIQIPVADKAGLIPADVLAQAQVEAETLPSAELGDALEAHINEQRAASANVATDATDTEVPARSLSALVSRHAATSTANREAECLAGTVYFESKGEPLDGQLAVAQTVLNRARSGRFPSSVCGVVFQKSQFSFVRGGGFPPIARSSQQWKNAVAIAHIAQNGLWDSSIANALFFHARHVSPGWRLKRIASVGNHIFYR